MSVTAAAAAELKAANKTPARTIVAVSIGNALE